MGEKLNVAIVTNSLAPYRLGFFEALGLHVELVIICDRVMNDQREWKIDLDISNYTLEEASCLDLPYIYKGPDGKYREKRKLSAPYGIFSVLERARPDMVVSLEFGIRTLLALCWCRLRKRKLYVWWEGTQHTERGVSWFKSKLRKFIIKHIDGAWSNGIESTAYLMNLGLKKQSIHNGMTGVDTTFFAETSGKLRVQRDDLRAELGVSGRVIGFSGRLTPLKGIKEMLDGISLYHTIYPNDVLCLLFIGEGDERPRIEQWAKANPKIPVHITGFVQMSDLLKYYVMCDAFCLPTLHDNWALASLEPLLCGVPSLVSIYNGSSSDLVDDVNGIIGFDPINSEDFTKALRQVMKYDVLGDEVIQKLRSYYSPESQASRAIDSFGLIF